MHSKRRVRREEKSTMAISLYTGRALSCPVRTLGIRFHFMSDQQKFLCYRRTIEHPRESVTYTASDIAQVSQNLVIQDFIDFRIVVHEGFYIY